MGTNPFGHGNGLGQEGKCRWQPETVAAHDTQKVLQEPADRHLAQWPVEHGINDGHEVRSQQVAVHIERFRTKGQDALHQGARITADNGEQQRAELGALLGRDLTDPCRSR